MIGLSRRKHLHESHCLARQWLPLRAVTLTRIAAQSTSDRSMLLCLSRGLDDISVAAVLRFRDGVLTGYCWFADKTGMGRSRWSAQALIRSRPAGHVRPGTAGESLEGQQVRGSRLSGQAVPGAFGR
jgi:hypothetical protein